MEFSKTVLSDNLRFRRANGTIVDKAIYLDDLMKPGNTTDELHSSDINARIHANLAVVDIVVGMKGMRCGNKLDGSFSQYPAVPQRGRQATTIAAALLVQHANRTTVTVLSLWLR